MMEAEDLMWPVETEEEKRNREAVAKGFVGKNSAREGVIERHRKHIKKLQEEQKLREEDLGHPKPIVYVNRYEEDVLFCPDGTIIHNQYPTNH